MRKAVRFAALAFIFSLSLTLVRAQGVNDVRINEVLIDNVGNMTDSFGIHTPWAELFNTGYESFNVNGCIIEVVYRDGTAKRFALPKNDNATQLGPQSYLLVYFDNPAEPSNSKSNFHTGISLENAVSIKFYPASGKEKDLVDTFDISALDVRPDVAYGHLSTESGIVALPTVTPGRSNEVESLTPRYEIFVSKDRHGLMMALIAMVVVISALFLISLVLRALANYMENHYGETAKKRKAEAASAQQAAAPAAPAANGKDAEIAAVIGAALCLFQSDSHDQETFTLTFEAPAPTQWSSKMRSMTQK